MARERRSPWLAVAIGTIAVLSAAWPVEAQTGPFFTPPGPFVDPNGGTGIVPDGNRIEIHLNGNANGNPDAVHDLPPEIRPAPNTVLQYRLSPSTQVLYTTKADLSCTGVTVYFHRLGAPPAMTPLAPGVCFDHGVAIGPRFFDPPPPANVPRRTAVIVGIAAPTDSQQPVLWVDLINGDHNLDVFNYDAVVEQTAPGIQFAPAGNAAIIRHGTTRIDATPRYTFIDLCRSPVAGVDALDPGDLPTDPGQITAHIGSSAAGLFAELRLNGNRVLDSEMPLNNCFGASNVLLELGKSGPAAVTSGRLVGYTLIVHNAGTAAATNVVLQDTVPVGTSYVFSAGTLTNGVVTWQLGDLAPGATLNVPLTVQAICPSATEIRNEIYSVGSDEVPTILGLPLPTVCNPVIVPVLRVSKAGPAVVMEGDRFDYTLTYSNVGNAIATAVAIEDQLPPGAVFVSASAGGTINAGRVTWNLGNLPAGQGGSVTLTVRAGCSAAQLQNGQYFIRSTQTNIVLGSPAVITNVTPASTAPVDVAITSVPVIPAAALEPGAIVQHTITLQNTVAERRPYVRFVLNAGRSSRFDQVLDAGGGTVVHTSPIELQWIGSLDPSGTVTIVITTRVEDCPNPADADTHLNNGQPVIVTDVCNRLLGSATAPGPFPLSHPVALSLVALGLGTPQPNFARGGPLQVGRADTEVDFQIRLTNQVSTPQQNVSASLPLPPELTPIGTPPFVAPFDPAATYDPATRVISWAGSLAPGEEVVITFRARLPPVGTCLTQLSLTAQADGCSNLVSGLSIAVVPPLPAEPHVVMTDNWRGLFTIRPGVDATAQTLLCFEGEIYSGMSRAPNGDIWVAGLPSYRFNPTTLDFEVLTAAFSPVPEVIADVAIDTTTTPATAVVLDLRQGTELRRYDPATGQVTVLRTGLSGLGRIVVDRRGRFVAVTTIGGQFNVREVVVVHPTDPALDRHFSDPLYQTLDFTAVDLDADGNLLVAVNRANPPSPDTQDLVSVDLETGAFTLVAADVNPLVPGLPGSGQMFQSLAVGASPDLYIGRRNVGGVGVVRLTVPPTGELLAISWPVVDLLFVDPAAVPPPPVGQVNIDVLETVLVADAVTPLLGAMVHVDEPIAVDDAVDPLLGVMLDVAEAIVADDLVNPLLGVMLDVAEQVGVNEDLETLLQNTPAGLGVHVGLRERVAGRFPVRMLFEEVEQAGNTVAEIAGGLEAPPGFDDLAPAIRFDIETTAVFRGAVTLCFDLAALGQPRPAVRVFHREGGEWVDRSVEIPLWEDYACAVVTFLSPFAVFQVGDVTAPELVVQFDPAASGVGVSATDSGSGVSAPPTSTSVPCTVGRNVSCGDDKLRYDASDRAGNTASMVLSIRKTLEKAVAEGGVRRRLNVVVKTIAYDGEAPSTAPTNGMMIDWTAASDGTLERLHQVFSVKTANGRETLDATWDRRTGVTTIKTTRPGSAGRISLDGIVLLRLATEAGALRVSY